MGATCTKLEPPAGDPMARYSRTAYEELHEGVTVLAADLKTGAGQQLLHQELQRTDVLLTSFRPSAMAKLGLSWNDLHSRYPALCQVAIVGSAGAGAEVPGHDLTYQAEHGLVTSLDLPATLYADMAGSLEASEAVLQAALLQRAPGAEAGRSRTGRYFEVALADAAAFLALPRRWGLTQPQGTVGGAHAGYRVYPCRDGRVAVAALEPHFAAALRQVAGLQGPEADVSMTGRATHAALEKFFAAHTRTQLDLLAKEYDLPLHTMS
jgi:alpha-methylacyl-CoA racemase